MSTLLRSVLCVGLLLVVLAGLSMFAMTAHAKLFSWIGLVGLALVVVVSLAVRRSPRSARRQTADDLAGYPMQLIRRRGFIDG